MHRIDSTTAAPTLPAPLAAGTPGYFAHAAPGSGGIPTVLTSDWANAIQEELINVLTAAGITPSKTANNQLLQSIQAILDTAGVNGAGSIFGLTLSNTVAFPTTSVSISAGLCRDSLNAASMALAAPISKSLTSVWAAGSGNGGRDAGTLANGQTWHVFLIKNPTSGVIDALFSQSPTAPTLPTGFTKFRRLGAIMLDAAATTIRAFTQTGDWFKLKSKSTDYASTANGSSTPYLRQITVPNGIKVEAEIYYQSFGTADANPYLSGVYDPDFGTPPAFGGATQWAQIRRNSFYIYPGAWNSYGTTVFRQFTDTTQHVYTYSSDTADVIALGVLGWRDERGKFF